MILVVSLLQLGMLEEAQNVAVKLDISCREFNKLAKIFYNPEKQ